MGFTNNNNDERIFYLSDDIDNKSVGSISFNLLSLIEKDNSEDSKQKDYKRVPIKLYINSNGGELLDAWGLIDIILKSETPIYTYCSGYAMSAGFLIFLAGHKRYMYKHSTLMYHQIWFIRSGTYQNFIENETEREYYQNNMEEYVKQRTTISQDILDEIRVKKKDWYIHYEDALKYGIAQVI